MDDIKSKSEQYIKTRNSSSLEQTNNRPTRGEEAKWLFCWRIPKSIRTIDFLEFRLSMCGQRCHTSRSCYWACHSSQVNIPIEICSDSIHILWEKRASNKKATSNGFSRKLFVISSLNFSLQKYPKTKSVFKLN